MVMLTTKITHFTFHRNCFYGITLAWPCWDHWDKPPKVGLETINLNHQPRKRVYGQFHSPLHYIIVPKNQPPNPPRLFYLFI